MDVLEKKCPRCGKASKDPSNPSGRCSKHLSKLSADKKKPGHWQRAQTKADDALRRQDGKNGTASHKSSGRGTRKSIVKQMQSAEKKTGQKLSPDRKNNSKGYAASNTRAVPEKLNVGRHKVDPKKLAAWRKKLKKYTNMGVDDLKTLMAAKAYENGNEELAKSVENMTDEGLFEFMSKGASPRAVRILIIQGGSRSKKTCPGEDSKGQLLVKELKKSVPSGVELDILDLAVTGDDRVIRDCKNCVGTAGGYHCHWKCSCYGPGSASEDLSDVMHDEKVYDRFEEADGFIVLTPTNWGKPTSRVITLFDRMVCASLSLTNEQAKELFDGDIKNAAKTQKAHRSGEHEHLLKNHLEGKVAGFYMWGVGGGNDYTNRPMPASMKGYEHTWNEPNSRIDDLVDQCRHSGIHVPEDLIKTMVRNTKEDYSTIDDEFRNDPFYVATAKTMLKRIVEHVHSLRNNQNI